MICPSFGGGTALWGEKPGVWPVQDVGVCGSGGGVIVFAGDIEIEVDEGLGVGFEEGGVTEDVCEQRSALHKGLNILWEVGVLTPRCLLDLERCSLDRGPIGL